MNNSSQFPPPDEGLHHLALTNQSTKLLIEKENLEDEKSSDQESRVNPRFVGFELVDSGSLHPHWRHLIKSKRIKTF
jgi:hypothetical protein